MSKNVWAGAVAAILALAVPAGALAQAAPASTAPEQFQANLNGYQEVPTLASDATGQFTAQLSADGSTIQYQLTYSGFDVPVTAAHLHLGRRGVAGGIIAFLCGGGNKPACPAQGPVSGTIAASDVTGPTDQGINAGELAKLVRALRAGAVFANVHTQRHPNGEIRGQVTAQALDLE